MGVWEGKGWHRVEDHPSKPECQGLRVAMGIEIAPDTPEPEASRRGCPAQDQASQRGGPESERGERMTRVPSAERVEMGATRAGVSLGVGREVARPSLRPPPAQKTSPTGTRTAGSKLATAREHPF
jgi:hypothetical protein